MTRTIEFFFAIGSPWVYLGLEEVKRVADAHGATLVPRPITLITENGGIFSKDRPEPRRRYWLREVERWSIMRGKMLVMTDRGHLGDPTPAAHTVIAAAIDGADWFGVTRTLQKAFWEDKADIGDAAVRKTLLDEAGFDGAKLLAREKDADVQAAWNKNKADATSAGVFGVPTLRYDGELYWGQDNLGFLERHLEGDKLVPAKAG